jgi:hypothetical protein
MHNIGPRVIPPNVGMALGSHFGVDGAALDAPTGPFSPVADIATEGGCVRACTAVRPATTIWHCAPITPGLLCAA